MINQRIPQNRTRRQDEQLIYDILRERCKCYVEVSSKESAAEVSVQIKSLLMGLNLDSGYQSLMKNLDMQRKSYELSHPVNHYK